MNYLMFVTQNLHHNTKTTLLLVTAKNAMIHAILETKFIIAILMLYGGILLLHEVQRI